MASRALLVLAGLAAFLPAGAAAEQASQPGSPAAARIDAGGSHSCALVDFYVRCWGLGDNGQLGYASTNRIGDDETPGSAGPVGLGPGERASAVAAGDVHTCARLEDGGVRCWGFGGDGRLGYANTNTIGDDEPPGSVGRVDLGAGRSAAAITAGRGHTCALHDDGDVRCWGFSGNGELGYANRDNIGDDETPGSVGPVDIGSGSRATAISAGTNHTCALLDDGSVRCWGFDGGSGRLGRTQPANIGDDETPGSVAPVDLGGRATAISAGTAHTCALLENGSVRCWGYGGDGQLGYANTNSIGDNETPGSAGPVDLGAGRIAVAISAGRDHTCALLDAGGVRCWGYGGDGRLGYANTQTIGDNETPASAGPVDLGPGRTAVAISAGQSHNCARLDDDSVRCWGLGASGRLGYANESNVGDDEAPGSVGPVDLRPTVSIGDSTVREGDTGTAEVTFAVTLSGVSSAPVEVDFATVDDGATAPGDYGPAGGRVSFAPGARSATLTVAVNGDRLDEPDERFLVNISNPTNTTLADGQGTGTIADDDAPAGAARRGRGSDMREALARQRRRARALRRCLRGAGRRRAARRRCLARHGRTPGRVGGLRARARSARKIVLSFRASGSDGRRPPAARGYLVKQSTRPIRGRRGFRRAPALCRGNCRFKVTRVGARITLTVTNLRPHTTYHYAVAARDNVSRRLGPRSRTAKARTR